jgi:hypothetical protein
MNLKEVFDNVFLGGRSTCKDLIAHQSICLNLVVPKVQLEPIQQLNRWPSHYSYRDNNSISNDFINWYTFYLTGLNK